ncbi:MAG: hypothetical protein ACKVE4_04410 [Dissulfuribacterales bacterium]
MNAAAIVMTLTGIFLLYGGLSCCIGIAWYHGKSQKKKNTDPKGPALS